MNYTILHDAISEQTQRKPVSFLLIDSQSDDDTIVLYMIVYAYSYVIYPEGGGK